MSSKRKPVSNARQFHTMFGRLKNYQNMIAYRRSWDQDRYIYIGIGVNGRPVLYLHDGVHSDPYSVQQEDLFANDWEVEDG